MRCWALMRRSVLSQALFSAAVASVVSLGVWAQGAELGAQAVRTPGKPASMTASDVASFLDGILPLELERSDIAGVAVAVVKDGKLLFAGGYGYADVARKIPVIPEKTLFRPGSISKLFTWTAVMQLVEQGKLDLDRDIGDYLDFTIPSAFGKPITLRNIMTHTSGFEETLEELFIADARDMKPLGEYLKAHLPRRIFPPGTTPAYSNYAAALAGYIVERVSGEPYPDYIDAHIFKPLGMKLSTFRQPLPEALAPLMAGGYFLSSQPPKPFEIVQAVPAGGLSTTASDIARFMIAHLEDGRYGDARILRPETARLMHARAFVNLPPMNAMALGFYEESRNGHRIIGHGGDTLAFHSELALISDIGVGFFISLNSAGKGGVDLRAAVLQKLLDRYFPYSPPAIQPPPSTASDARSVSGWYITSRRADSTIMKLVGLVGELKVYPNPDGTISANLSRDLSGRPKRFQEIAPMLFRQVDGQDMVGFKKDESGRRVFVLDYPFMIFQQASWSQASGFAMSLLIASVLVLILTLLIWPAAALIRRHYGRPLQLGSREKWLRLAVRLVPALEVAFLAAWGATFMRAFTDIHLQSARLEPWLRFLQIIGWLGVVGTIAPLYNAVRSWMGKGRWIVARIGDTLIAIACLGYLWFVFSWNLLAFNLKY